MKSSSTDTTSQEKEQKQEKKDATKETQKKTVKWYEGKNKEIVIYYLIAVFFLEIIVGTAAFFYGVVHAEVVIEGGPKLANFPWVGWVISATLVPIFLLLLLHLSGWFFSRTLEPESGEGPSPGKTKEGAPIPKNVEMFYSVVSNAPVIVILLGLIALGGVLFFLDTALGTLRPYIPWILGSATAFLVISYIARLIFLARHHKMEREYAYRMQIFKETGVIITDKNFIPITAEQIAAANPLPHRTDLPALEEFSGNAESGDRPVDADETIEDATIIPKRRKPKKR